VLQFIILKGSIVNLRTLIPAAIGAAIIVAAAYSYIVPPSGSPAATESGMIGNRNANTTRTPASDGKGTRNFGESSGDSPNNL